jgi:hypothetical protein
VVVLESGVRVTFDPQAVAVTSMTAGTTSANLKRDRVGPGVEIIASTFLAILD